MRQTHTSRQVPRPPAGAGRACSHLLTRSAFLARAGYALVGAVAASAGRVLSAAPEPTEGVSPGSPATRATTWPLVWKGRADSRVTRWDVVTIGNLSRNRYWG